MADLIIQCPNCGKYKHPVSGSHFPHCGSCPPPGANSGEIYRRMIAANILTNRRRQVRPRT